MSRQARTSGPFLILLGCIACGDSGAPGNGVDGGTASNSGSGDDSNQGSGASMSGGGDNSGSDTDSDSDDGSNSTSPPGFIPGPYNKLIPTPPSDSSHVHNICVTQIDIDGAGQSRGTVCGFNPNFNDTWAGSEPSTCLGINSCTSTLGGVTYKAPPSVRFEVTSGFPVRLTAVILNCQQSPSVNHAAGCILSNDSASIPTSHETSWDMPNGNTGPSTTLTITQIATSNASSLTSKPPAEWPGSDVLIYDDYGNAVIFKLGVTACSGTGMCQ